MDPSQNDLEAIRRLIAELTTRVYRIERKLQMDVQPPAQAAAVVTAPPPPPKPVTVILEKPPAPYTPIPQLPPRPATVAAPSEDLESRIGSH